MRKNGTIKYAGYLKEKDLHEDLLRHIGDNDIALYKPPSAGKKQAIQRSIYTEIKTPWVLPHPDPPIFVFVYPWFPTIDDRVLFKGVTALATYYTMHLFIDLNSYTQASLRETITHEWNHLVFYRCHPERRYTLRAHMAMEGLAEVFREEIAGGKPAPWSLALTREEARKQFVALKGRLDMKGMKIYRQVFFGNKKYKRWTGYSVAYRLIKEFRGKNSKVSWKTVMEMEPKDILETIAKKRA